MPPKRWGAKLTATSSERALALLKDYITREIGKNNGLGLPENEMECMANELVGAKTRAEVFAWCKTLMLKECVAAEIVKRREDDGPCFAGDEGADGAEKGLLGCHIPTVSEAMQKPASRVTGTSASDATTKSSSRAKATQSKSSSNKTHGSVSVQPGKSSATKFGLMRELRMDNSAAGSPTASLKPGRFECGCFATVHSLRGSCRNCGRVICEQEDDSVCYFCNMDPHRCVAYEIAVEEGRVDAAAMARDRAQYEAALAQRDKLLAYAQQRAKRTIVIDDQADSLLNPGTRKNSSSAAGQAAHMRSGLMPSRLTSSAAAPRPPAPTGKVDVWLSPEEREQQAEQLAEQQRQVEMLHRRRGAYQVQIDLFGEAVPLVVSKGLPVQVDMSNVKWEGCAEGSKDEDAAGQRQQQQRGEGNAYVCAETRSGRCGDDTDTQGRHPNRVDSYDDLDDRNDTRNDSHRAGDEDVSLSTRMKAIWYDKADSHRSATLLGGHFVTDPLVVSESSSALHDPLRAVPDNKKARSRTKQKTNTVTATPMRKVNDSVPQPYDEISRRVQQDYYSDDWSTYASAAREEAREELVFLPHILDSDCTGSEEDHADESRGADTVSRSYTDAATASSASPLVEQGIRPHSSSAAGEACRKTKAGDVNSGSPDRRAVYTVCTVPTRLMRARDDGVCLSMHQPWASLLVAGIKVHEGRGWSTPYRGRLWIHAASVTPTMVAQTEEHYSAFMSPTQSFPAHYPTRVLLGYVYLTDCLDREAYESAYAPSERQENSPYTFICAEPRVLPFPLPMSGSHKLFTLERKVHTAAKKQLMEIL